MMRTLKVCLTVAAMLAVVACDGDDDDSSARGGPGGPGGGAAEVEVSVETVDATRGEFRVSGDYAGEFRSEGMTELSAEVAGRITSMSAHIGDSVEEGQVLAQIDDLSIRQALRELEATVAVSRANLEEAKVTVENLEAALRRKEPLLAREMVSEREIEDLEGQIRGARQRVAVANANIEQNQARLASAREDLRNTEVRAPFAGKIGMRYVERGTHVSPGQAIYDLLDDGDLYVAVRVPERNAARVHLETPVTVRVGSAGSQPLKGSIHRIAPSLDSATRSLRVDVVVEDTQELYIRPGMYGRLSLELGYIPDALTISNQAILRRTDGEPYVWIVTDDVAEQRSVTLGLAGRSRSQILEGLEEGDRIVLRGHEKLEDGTKIRDLRFDGDVPEPPPASADEENQ